jgi:predicted HicB family RNase H-like nuclease
MVKERQRSRRNREKPTALIIKMKVLRVSDPVHSFLSNEARKMKISADELAELIIRRQYGGKIK